MDEYSIGDLIWYPDKGGKLRQGRVTFVSDDGKLLKLRIWHGLRKIEKLIIAAEKCRHFLAEGPNV